MIRLKLSRPKCAVIGYEPTTCTVCRIPSCSASDMAEIDPDRFTRRPVDALREAYAQAMDEHDLVKELVLRPNV